MMKDWSKDFVEYDDDDDKVEERLKKKLILMFLISSFRGQKKTKIEKLLLFVDLNVEENDLYNLIVVELV